MIMLSIWKMMKILEDSEESVRCDVLNDLINKAFDPAASEAERSVRMSFNAHLLTKLREEKLWPVKEV